MERFLNDIAKIWGTVGKFTTILKQFPTVSKLFETICNAYETMFYDLKRFVTRFSNFNLIWHITYRNKFVTTICGQTLAKCSVAMYFNQVLTLTRNYEICNEFIHLNLWANPCECSVAMYFNQVLTLTWKYQICNKFILIISIQFNLIL